MIATRYANTTDGSCTACPTPEANVVIELGDNPRQILRLCAACRVDLAKRLMPALEDDTPKRKKR